jgi:predicted glycosyltransferase
LGAYAELPEHGDLADWPAGDGPKCLAYLSAGYAALDDVLVSLCDAPYRTLVAVPGMPDAWCAHWQSRNANLRVTGRVLGVRQMLRDTDFVVGQGGITLTTQALCAGKPVLCLPRFAEQYITGERIAALGVGHNYAPPMTAPSLASLLQEMATSPLRSAAEAFAGDHPENHAPPHKLVQWITNTEAACR